MDVGAVWLHIYMHFFQSFRIKQFIEPLISEFLLKRPADSFLVSQFPDFPDRISGAVKCFCDLGVIVLEA